MAFFTMNKDSMEKAIVGNLAIAHNFYNLNDANVLEDKVSSLVSSVKELQRQERIEKRRRWRNAGRIKRKY